jgi:predicted MFS family arabinose efflux permease
MVRDEDVMNAVGLNSAVFNGARMIGPAVAGILIEKVSMSLCFFANGLSFLAVIVALALMRDRELHRQASSAGAKGSGQIRAGLRYVRHNPDLFLPLLLMAVVGTFGLNFQTVMPLFARFTFHGNSSVFGTLSAVMALGSLFGAMYAATRKIPSRQLLVWSAIAFGLTETGAAVVPTLHTAYIELPLLGLAAMLFISTSNTVMQVYSSREMRGRSLALWSLVFLGSTPIGGPIVGWISQTWSPRWGFAVGGLATLLAGTVMAPFLLKRRTPPLEAEIDEIAEIDDVETVEAAS